MTTDIVLSAAGDTMALIEQELARDPRLKSQHTRRGYLADLAAFEHWREGRTLTKLLVESYAAELQRAGRAPSGINRALASVRWWARRLGDLAYEDSTMPLAMREEIATQSARVASVGDVTGGRAPAGRNVDPGELAALVQVCAADPTPAGARDAAMIAIAWNCGLRRGELAGLQLADYTPTGKDEGELVIRGKGDKVRTAYVYNGAGQALADWLVYRGDAPGPLFLAVNKGGNVVTAERTYGRRGPKGSKIESAPGLSTEALEQILQKRRTEAGVKPLTWHDFRRTFAGNLLDAGHDLVTVQKLMGHASPVTTSNYDRRGEEVKRKAIRSLHVPYHRRALA
ncbi:MAG TPA: tyrosine-type recombinase/integrase [Tepidisphaeraceae bacterium]|nr:tyrosine-type recombinase/integrase [Tepidisphaeraceae bacterium]